ncbi:coenzyme F420-dependent N5,N10-methenyltetrahydromethanopterin reductase [Amycolatopsis mediterranei S699]|uniref:Coenzyme F420-dependent N5,N10-methenyltetrahydromethanopterin reductase n=2 Tax=Amycolatopsis mediterranei TaxID=33910 RepID=A0A0H3DJA3_AMYMU|nr:coenzyme F420-dependent N5,N10-methenyltetrahydromethanopterin reductase [Amycolatopsis mediterranei U32]AEK47955.1 coenzyme F420-dependent N5,N10-methenyltetrahydromethanopterin reductase [Amycolatopsis mediterranei S699]AGT89775.1 coenzyme F420-dependent N5,N10-methenyltetrahydromethanopterin reductase [Amycolatopsis mediterranei RB]KDO12066.1 N5,N10-methylene tetrahydromethanopterin reductase [Amycolatopsis mediterranei]AFO82646.1 coenzyme F420-dependent N5,N10-methenyltetrahydromethanopt
MAKCRQAEDLGYDVVGVVDHLGRVAPVPALLLAAEATERLRLNTYVLNASFHNPVLLARDLAALDEFTGGRVEIGIGAGYVREEFEAAGIDWGTPGRRFRRLVDVVTELERAFTGRPRPPLLLGGRGDRMLTFAAAHADTISLTGTAPGAAEGRLALAGSAALAERADFVKRVLDGRDAEVNLMVHFVRITDDRRAALEEAHQLVPHLDVEELGELATVLAGSADGVAEQLLRTRETLGAGYFTVLEDDLTRLAPVIEKLH